MRKDIAGPGTESTTPMWESLERLVREKAQEFIQQILEEEVTEVLGRGKSQRKAAVDPTPGYRNGYGKPRPLAMSSGTITLRRPRVRGLEERFESRVLPLFARRTKEVAELIPELYLHGLSEGETSSWRSEACWARERRCRKPRSGDCGPYGRPSTRRGRHGPWRTGRSSMCGPTGSM